MIKHKTDMSKHQKILFSMIFIIGDFILKL